MAVVKLKPKNTVGKLKPIAVPVKGDKGDKGDPGTGIKSSFIRKDGHLVLVLTDGRNLDVGHVVGANGKDGRPGRDGKNGRDGIGIQGPPGKSIQGPKGEDGKPGKDGITEIREVPAEMPVQVNRDEIRLLQPDGRWSPWYKLRPGGGGGGGAKLDSESPLQMEPDLVEFAYDESEMCQVNSATRDGLQYLFDYDTRTDNQYVYQGVSSVGTLTSATDWTIFKATYDSEGRIIRKQKLQGAWDDRAALAWL